MGVTTLSTAALMALGILFVSTLARLLFRPRSYRKTGNHPLFRTKRPAIDTGRFFAAMPCDVNDAPPSPVQMNILTDKISPHGLPQVIDKRLIR